MLLCSHGKVKGKFLKFFDLVDLDHCLKTLNEVTGEEFHKCHYLYQVVMFWVHLFICLSVFVLIERVVIRSF